MLFRRKIPCYVLVFDQVDLIKKSLNFLAAKSRELEIIVIENSSANTPVIKEWIDRLGRAGVVSRYYLFKENITGNAYGAVLDNEIDTVKKSPLVLVTDGDLTALNQSWLDEEKEILNNNAEVFTCGISLNMFNLPLKAFPEAVNWIPLDRAVYDGFIEAVTGVHLLLFRGDELASFVDWWRENKTPFVDGELHKYCYEVIGKKWARTKYSKARHLTWDLYADLEHTYTKKKTSKNFRSTWLHQKTASFEFIDYS